MRAGGAHPRSIVSAPLLRATTAKSRDGIASRSVSQPAANNSSAETAAAHTTGVAKRAHHDQIDRAKQRHNQWRISEEMTASEVSRHDDQHAD